MVCSVRLARLPPPTGSRMLVAGVQPKFVWDLRGHRSLQEVMRYSHVTMTMQREATEALRRALG